MATRKRVLEGMPRNRLLDLARSFEFKGLTASSKDEIADALASKRSIPIIDMLDQLSRDELKEICENLGLDNSGREKAILIARIMGDEKAPEKSVVEKKESRKEQKVTQQPTGKEKEAQAYVHEESKVSLRPEIGTQAQFKKKKPPRTYKYDSSLSPNLEWDGQNHAREQGEALIKAIIEAKDMGEAKEAALKLKALSKPFLNWAGKAERLSFDVPTLPLFVHERMSTQAIIETLKSHKKKDTTDFPRI
jgi:hypothetical protein